MSLPFKPHIIALLCSAGLLAAAGTLYVQAEPQRRSLNRLRSSASARSVDDTAGGRHLHPRKLISGSPLSRSTRTVCCRRC